MEGRRGRSNADMLARMGRILLLLRAYPAGLTTDEILDRVGYGAAKRTSRMRALNRDLAALKDDGWRIETPPTANTPALRVLHTVDNRFATLFSPAQRAQLARAALCAGPDVADALADDLGRAEGPPAFVAAPVDGLGRLSVCQTATADRCRLRFTYNGLRRSTHPFRVVLRPGGWYLQARDEGDGVIKVFSIDRMRGLASEPPGTAEPAPATLPEPVWDFMLLPIHDPVTVTVETTETHLPEVLSALAGHGYEIVAGEDPQRIRVEVPVTNTRALIDRVIVLGPRVWLRGPEDVRAALRERLIAAAGRR